jgi:membrane associated rhomboid family serine protease
MHYVASIQESTTPISWPCPNATELSGASVSCSLSDLRGFGGVPDIVPGRTDNQPPHQWFRFIVPIFLHAGIIHIGFNMLLQLTLGRDVELLIGSIRFAIVYFAAGIFGFVLGGNFAAAGIASTGCSGSLFGILAISLIDILYTWKDRPSPWKDIIFVCVDVAIAFVLGLLPGLDNFSHIGGFLMGFVLGICLLRSPKSIARRTIPEVTYTIASQDKQRHGLTAFAKDPREFFLHRRGVWWAWWLLRGAALIGVLISFILLLKNFYVWMNTCSWCKYLSCLDVTVGGTSWCDIGNLHFTPNNSTSPARRDFFMSGNL